MIQALFIIAFIFALIASVSSANGAVATIIAGSLTAIIILVVKNNVKESEERDFIFKFFLGGLLLRLILGFFIYTFNLELSFGPDAYTYNSWGTLLSNCWWGTEICRELNDDNWGMHYFTGIIYFFTGPNLLAIQFISAVFGALTAILVYLLTKEIFLNKRVARYSALSAAFFPALIIFSAQLLKDGLIVFLLITIMFMVIKLQKRFNLLEVLTLLLALFGIFALRFYLFYMVGVATVGAIILGTTTDFPSFVRRAVVVGTLMIGFLLLGIQDSSNKQIERFSFENMQRTRESAADVTQSNSSIESDIDVSTTSGAISALPLGIITILMAPFPWQMRNITQILTLPEMIVWWGIMPFMYIGIKYTIKNRLRESIAIIIFTFGLLLIYSVYQGNVGTIYRQRTQIQIFLLVFASVGYVVQKEKIENRRINKSSLKQLYSIK